MVLTLMSKMIILVNVGHDVMELAFLYMVSLSERILDMVCH
jgi:hypothetical protein